LLDLDQSLAVVGRERFFDRRWWYTSRFPFSPAAAQDVRPAGDGGGGRSQAPRAKVIALDADSTLIALGLDYPGNCYVAFQPRVLEYRQRGFVLASCSKNNEADVLEVLRRHPHQILREGHRGVGRLAGAAVRRACLAAAGLLQPRYPARAADTQSERQAERADRAAQTLRRAPRE
jgi:predicted enzyme involved in methoxymalonyl-ACP biosynthesis